MDDRRRHDRPEGPDPSEGVRIIGEDEAEEVRREREVKERQADDELRFGDRPPAPEGPRPALRFPRADDDPNLTLSAPLPHWTEPATGQVPTVVSSDDEDLDAWSSFASSSPRWRDQPSDWEAEDFPDDELVADAAQVASLDARRRRHEDLFDDLPIPPAPMPASSEPGVRNVGSVSSRPPASRAQESVTALPMGRSVPVALATGAAFAVLALLLLSRGAGPMMFLVVAVITVAAAELYKALQTGGNHPATLVGLTTTVGLVSAAYWKGEAAYPVVMGLGVATTLLWYLVGVTRVRIAANAGVTILGFAYVGLFGSFAALLLRWPGGHGTGLLLGALLATVGYDTVGFFVGRRMGSTPLATEISPNKTVEGLIGGVVGSVVISVVVVAQIGPWTVGSALLLGLVAAVAAPIGDLVESMIKRDLGVKDSGSILPGHGGLLDRFDGLLFVLPAVYYLALVLDLGLS